MGTNRSRPSGARFVPPRCPHSDCAAHNPALFLFHRKGFFRRACDGVRVQRFRCLSCNRKFSVQTFRLDYRLKRPDVHVRIFERFADKSSMRKIARELGLNRELVRHRLVLLGKHCKERQEHDLRELAKEGGLEGPFLLDELETFEQDRKLKPVTVPVLIEGQSWFILHAETAPLAPRGRRTAAEQRRLEGIERFEGKRKSGSTQSVRSTFERLARVAPAEGKVRVTTDQKCTYATALRRQFGERLVHLTVNSREHRGTKNPLFPINHTLARLRDTCSRLVRRSWCASKRREYLEHHLWIVIGFRNYVDGWRSEPVWKQRTSAAARVGLESERLTAEQFLRWRDPLAA